jgi:hypothetical protein
VVEGNGLENRRAGNGTVGSNPTPSAKQKKMTENGLLSLFHICYNSPSQFPAELQNSSHGIATRVNVNA